LFANVTRTFWVDVKIPSVLVTAGQYTGQVKLTDASTGAVLTTVPVHLDVWPIAHECLEASARSFGKAWGFDTVRETGFSLMSAFGGGSIHNG
jgi:hypothetical protein